MILKNMSPRERMRLRKQKKADEEAKRMRFVLYIYYIQCIQTITNSDSFVRINLRNSTLEHCDLTEPPHCSN